MEKATMEKEYNVKEIASKENVSIHTVYRWCIEGYVQYSRRPTGKGQGGIIIKEAEYQEFKKLFRKNA